jgi:DNA-binding LacI/PurR family transcriptional regulator
VARRAGLSRATISAVLRNDYRINPKTRIRVHRIVAKMGYVKNPIAAALATHSKMKPVHALQVAIITDDCTKGLGNAFDGAHPTQMRLAELGYASDHFDLSSSQISAAKLRDRLYHRGYCGVIFSEIRNSFSEVFSVDWSSFCLVCMGRAYRFEKFDTVRDSSYHSVTISWQAIRQAGYKRIGFLLCRHNPPMLDDREREASLWSCQQELTAQECCIPPYLGNHWDPPNIQKWLQYHRPDAVVGFNDTHYHMLQKMGLKIPQDLAYANLMTGGDIQQAGVCQAGEMVKIKAAEHLDSLVRYKRTGFPDEPCELVMVSQWRPGPSLPILNAITASSKK